MPRLLASLFLLTLIAPALAQSSGSTSSTPNQPQQSGAPVATLRAGTELVIVDVVVTDSKHNPVHHLKPSDFVVLENNVSQPLKNFEEHTALSSADAAKLEPMPKMPPGAFTNFTPAPALGPLNILLLDKLNTPLADQSRMRQELMDYTKKVKPGTRIAIFALTTRLVLLQGFTEDPALLRSALNDKAAPAMMPAGALQVQNRIQITLDAMSQLGLYLSSIQGHKNLIWFSGSFPAGVFARGNTTDPVVVVPGAEQQFRDTNDLLSRGQVSVYPVDDRGLMVMPNVSAALRGFPKPAVDRAFAGQLFDDHTAMKQIAYETGGRAIVDANGLGDAVSEAINEGSNYYTIAYTPTDSNWNGAYRKIEVRLRQQGYELSYRHGYYANDPDSRPAVTPRRAGTAGTAAMRLALKFGSPDPTQIVFSVQVLPIGATPEDALVPGNEGSANLKGPYRRYSLNIAASPRTMTFTTSPDGMHHGAMEFVTFVYDADGKLVNALGNPVHADYNHTLYLKALELGIPFHQEVSVPAKGEYFLRISVHDLMGDHVGALEVPISTVRNLPPASASK